ncbi:MAG: NAD(P)-binding domain-containing protein [Candidatus Dormibacteraeota bacterium]|uniref:Monooxygenase n=1 Tax=Candidatus Aeolococcus gillhamiae TaxID=3127015 RepID=A0A2W5Z2W8_9BACT|nr:NAD(P)-binding domain-containing protein [Candidatus Dormibacteraeota bacterium]PZR79560.1 MAG: monooxygenase [Candidatus Dormibacter sp. RRmetagenome_bin12]
MTTAAPSKRVCVIGAGPSGIAASKALHERDFSFDCFERRSRAGGLWAVADGDIQASYPSLECNTSKRRTEFSDYPMPQAFPPYPHNTQMAAYFNAYIDHFGFRDHITFNTSVEHAARAAERGWEVQLSTGGTRQYDAVVVANGHHREPRWPSPPLPGEFSGRQMHAHDYVGPDGFEGRSVVVLGMGNSAMDIAVELSGVAGNVYLASRRGAHIVPKFALGRPIDSFNTALPLPWSVKRAFFSLIVRGTIGRPEDVGLPKPDHRLGEAHPTVSQRITERVRAGAVTPKPNIESFAGSRVRFTDGSEVVADAVVYCTGYNVSFPFLDADVFSAVDNRVDLFHQVFPPGVANLAFIGLVQPFGALMPIAEAQAQWVADQLAGDYRLPTIEVMRGQIRHERAVRERQFLASPRHTMEIDFYAYLRGLRAERRRGHKSSVTA